MAFLAPLIWGVELVEAGVAAAEAATAAAALAADIEAGVAAGAAAAETAEALGLLGGTGAQLAAEVVADVVPGALRAGGTAFQLGAEVVDDLGAERVVGWAGRRVARYFTEEVAEAEALRRAGIVVPPVVGGAATVGSALAQMSRRRPELPPEDVPTPKRPGSSRGPGVPYTPGTVTPGAGRKRPAEGHALRPGARRRIDFDQYWDDAPMEDAPDGASLFVPLLVFVTTESRDSVVLVTLAASLFSALLSFLSHHKLRLHLGRVTVSLDGGSSSDVASEHGLADWASQPGQEPPCEVGCPTRGACYAPSPC